MKHTYHLNLVDDAVIPRVRIAKKKPDGILIFKVPQADLEFTISTNEQSFLKDVPVHEIEGIRFTLVSQKISNGTSKT